MAYKHIVKHTWPHPNILGLCMFNFAFICHHPCLYCTLPCLHLVLNAFWHSDPYIFLHFVGKIANQHPKREK